MMKTAALISCFCFVCTSAVGATSKTAALRATSRSLTQEPITRFITGIGNVTTFFTTYDGTSGLPLFDTNSAAFSEELRPRAGQANTYEGDYLNFNSTFGILAYGFGTLIIPGTDSDANSIPDIFQFERSAAVSFTGLIQSDYPSVIPYATRGTLTKNANDYGITISTTATDPGGVSQTLTGRLIIGYFTGVASYTREDQSSQNKIDLTLTGTIGGAAPVTYTASAVFTIVGPDQISLPQLLARRPDGGSIDVFPMVLKRRGNKYVGDFEISDGYLSTSWRDYTKWVLELTDTNDSDGDGIPDFSDSVKIAPVISVQPLSQTLVAGEPLLLSVVASGQPVPTYQWQYEGVNLLGQSGTSLSIDPVQEANSGRYRVVVNNSAGTATSSEATITVLPRPKLNASLVDKKVKLSWPVIYSGFVLESRSGSGWALVPDATAVVGNEKVVVLGPAQTLSLFRLRK